MWREVGCNKAFSKFVLEVIPEELEKFLDSRAVDVIMFRVAKEGAKELISTTCNDLKCVMKETLETLKRMWLIDNYRFEGNKTYVKLMSNERHVIAFILGAIVGIIEKNFGNVNVISPIGKYLSKNADVIVNVKVLENELAIELSNV